MEKLDQNFRIFDEHRGRVIERGKYSHVMALTLNPLNQDEGVIRCIVERTGDVSVKGYVDRSALYRVESTNGLEQFKITQPLIIRGKDAIVQGLLDDTVEFVGLEDPDIVVDPDTEILHVFFTIPLLNKDGKSHQIHLGHAQGMDLDSLEMTAPVLSPPLEVPIGAKELSLAPTNSRGIRLNLVESSEKVGEIQYSTVRIGVAKNLGLPWEFGDTVIHPKNDGYPWCAEHVSPGPLLPQEFVDVGENRRLGILNGREASQRINGRTKYGTFSVGLFIYNYEEGKVDWISEKPIIIDSQAATITFGSEFVQTEDGEGILYAHVDDSFVRAYTLHASGLKQLIP